jgi:hypothetical protein
METVSVEGAVWLEKGHKFSYNQTCSNSGVHQCNKLVCIRGLGMEWTAGRVVTCMISGFFCGVREIFALLGYCAA